MRIAQASQKLNFGSHRDWLHHLPELVNEQTRHLITQEIAFYTQRGQNQAGAFYRELQGLLGQQGPNRFVIQVGWGGGWNSKTLAYLAAHQDQGRRGGAISAGAELFQSGGNPLSAHPPRCGCRA
ncbi:MAG: hypothetical protein HC804_11965 [Anaerolineae bacterium]|nr:hypothetical protein [Anaerolineae bacterium]